MDRGIVTLKPFPGTEVPDGLGVRCDIGRRENVLSVAFELLGTKPDVLVPAPAAVPSRKDGLWENTCFELFLAPRDSQRYWEFNLSPSGDWNVYRFDGYREGMREEEAYSSLPLETRREGDSFVLLLAIDLGGLIRADLAVDAAISAVIRRRGQEVSYWALVHCGPRPDFHRRDGFTMDL
ncbi:MAG: DOMON-like domain-containing protein [Syntrophobacteraceae bacterium]